MERARDGSATAPDVGGRIINLELSLAGESANHVDLSSYLGDGYLGALRWHRRTACPAPSLFGCEGGRAHQHRNEQHGGESRFELIQCHPPSCGHSCRRMQWHQIAALN